MSRIVWSLLWSLLLCTGCHNGCINGCIERAEAQGYGYGYGVDGPVSCMSTESGESAVNVIDKYTWDLAFDAKDADVGGATWPASSGVGTLGEPTPGWDTSPTTGVSTSGLVDSAIGSNRVNQATLTAEGASDVNGWNNDAADDVIFPAYSEFHARLLVDIGPSLTGSSGAVFQFLFSGLRYFDFNWTSESGGNHNLRARLRNDNDGGSAGGINETISIPLDNGWTLVDFVARNVGGVSRLDVYVDGVEIVGTAHDALLTVGHDTNPIDAGIGSNRNGAGALGWPVLFLGYRSGAIDLATHQADAQALGLYTP